MLVICKIGILPHCLYARRIRQGGAFQQFACLSIVLLATGEFQGVDLALEHGVEGIGGLLLAGFLVYEFGDVLIQLTDVLHRGDVFPGGVEGVVGLGGLIEAAGMGEFDKLLLLFGEFAQVDASELVDIGIEVLQLVIVAVFEFVEFIVIILFLQFPLFLEFLQFGPCFLVFLMITVHRRLLQFALQLREVGTLYQHNLERLLVARDVPLLHGRLVHQFKPRFRGGTERHPITRLQRGKLQSYGPIGRRRGGLCSPHLHLHPRQRCLLLFLVILLYHTRLRSLRQGGESGGNNQYGKEYSFHGHNEVLCCCC